MTQRRTLAQAALAAVLLSRLGAPALAQIAPTEPIGISTTGQPTSFDLNPRDAEVTGYGRARFGMSPAEVQAVVATDYPGAKAGTDETEPLSRRRVMVFVLPTLAPGQGPATVTYVFGPGAQKLLAVNVYWLTPGDATPAQRAAMVAAGSDLTATLVGSYWAPLATARGFVLEPGVVILFASKDKAGRGIEVRLDGVPLDLQRPSSTGTPKPIEHLAAPAGRARLRLAVVANPAQVESPPSIPPGAF